MNGCSLDVVMIQECSWFGCCCCCLVSFAVLRLLFARLFDATAHQWTLLSSLCLQRFHCFFVGLLFCFEILFIFGQFFGILFRRLQWLLFTAFTTRHCGCCCCCCGSRRTKEIEKKIKIQLENDNKIEIKCLLFGWEKISMHAALRFKSVIFLQTDFYSIFL